MPYKCLVRDRRHHHLIFVAEKSRKEVVTIIKLLTSINILTLLSFSFFYSATTSPEVVFIVLLSVHVFQ